MEFATNELSQPVIYLINYVSDDKKSSFQCAVSTLSEAETFVGNRTCFEIIEQDMMTHEQVPMTLIENQREQKILLLDLYKAGQKRDIFESLDIRKPFQSQLKFPIAPELAKAEQKAMQI